MTTSLADPPTATYTLIDEPDRIKAVDENGVEIAGAFKPDGYDHWRIYATCRLTTHTHFVLAPSRQIATWHVEMLADLYVRGQR